MGRRGGCYRRVSFSYEIWYQRKATNYVVLNYFLLVVNAHQEPHPFDRETAVLEDHSFRAATAAGLPGV